MDSGSSKPKTDDVPRTKSRSEDYMTGEQLEKAREMMG